MFTLAADGVQEYFTYNPVLYEILKMERLKPFRNEGRLRISVKENGVDFKFYAYDLAIACYDGEVTPESFVDEVQALLDQKSIYDLDVDHLDNNVHNNTRGNIVLMDSGLNRKKAAVVTRFTYPFYLNSVYCDEEFRIQLICIAEIAYIENLLRQRGIVCKTEGVIQTGIHFRCNSAEDYVDCLYCLARSCYSWCHVKITPQKHNRTNKEIRYWASDIANSLHAQKILALMPQDEFDIYPYKRTDIDVEKT